MSVPLGPVLFEILKKNEFSPQRSILRNLEGCSTVQKPEKLERALFKFKGHKIWKDREGRIFLGRLSTLIYRIQKKPG